MVDRTVAVDVLQRRNCKETPAFGNTKASYCVALFDLSNKEIVNTAACFNKRALACFVGLYCMFPTSPDVKIVC
jgi:hypothetical protein